MDDFNKRLTDDLAELQEHFEDCTKKELCELLDHYISTVGKEQTIGTREYNVYIKFLTDEIDKKI